MPAERWLAAAAWLGEHALAAYAVTLVALLLAAWAGWAAWGQVRRVRDDLSPPAGLLLNLVAGFGIVAAGATGFAEIAEQLGPGGTMARVDDALSAAIGTHVGAATLHAFTLMTQLGDALVLSALGVVFAIGLWWRHQRSLALAWVLALAGNALLNPTLKRIFERIRPVHEHGLVSEAGWSFPSGHTSGATVAYGMLAFVAIRTLPPRWHLPAVLGATGLAYTVGSSRVFLQVHFASDVAAGFASGGAWLMVCVVSIVLSERWRLARLP